MSSGSDGTAAAAPPLERMWRRDRAVVVAALALLWMLTIGWLATGAGLGMDPREMTAMAWLPQHHAAPDGDMSGTTASAMDMPGRDMSSMHASTMDMPATAAAWTPTRAALLFAMWWTMMVAMMAPSAAPAILLYARVHRHAGSGAGTPTAPTGAFVAGYFLVWGAFALAATAAQIGLERAGVLSATTMGFPAERLAGAVLVAAGLWQFTPWKDACLSQCRAPAAFLSAHWRPGARGALRLGVRHGAYCLGCCWALMTLLFVGGVMNVLWIAALSLLVLAEKLLPAGRGVGRAAGALLVLWGVAVAFAR